MSMKQNNLRPGKLSTFTMIALASLMFSFPPNAQAQVSKLVGEWKLSKTEDAADTRTIVFKKPGNTVTGTYTNAAGEESRITSISFVGQLLTFRISALSMTVRLTMENDNLFKGRMGISGDKVPYEVQMVRKG
jgi:hypothetical protein